MQPSTNSTEQPISANNALKYFIAYGICFISLGLSGAALGPLLPALSAATHTSLALISFIFTARSLGYLLGSWAGGHVYDRVNGHKLMIAALTVMMIGHLSVPLLPVYIFILVVMFFVGLGQSIIDIGGNVNLLWVYQSKVGPYMSGMHFSFGLGAFLSPMLLNAILRSNGGSLTWPFWVLGIAFLPGIFSLIFLRAPQNPEKEIVTNNSGKSNSVLVLLLMLMFLLYVGIEGGFGGWIFTYVTEGDLASDTAGSYINSLFWGAIMLGRFVSIPLAKKISPSKMLLANFVSALIFLSIILIWPANYFVVWLVSIGFGLSLSSVFPTLMALSETRMKVTGRITSLFFIGVSLGALIMPTLLGQIFDYIGSYYIMVALFTATGLGLLVLLSVLLVSKRVGEKERI
jgi:FHS family Na+ dependent glucose MFS transporter 1